MTDEEFLELKNQIEKAHDKFMELQELYRRETGKYYSANLVVAPTIRDGEMGQ